jgi:alpha-N-arabinofuranosidase
MNLEPVFAVWGGYYLNGFHVQQGDLQPYVDDVINELEFLMVSLSHCFLPDISH